MIKCLELVFVFFIIAIVVGSVPIRLMKDQSSGLLKAIVYGNIMMLVIFEIIVIPMTIMGQSLTRLTQVWCIVIVTISIIAAITAKGYLAKVIKRIPERCRSLTYLDGVVLVLIFVQMFICVEFIFLHANDAYYVGMATTTLESDSLLKFSPYTGAAVQWSDYKYHMIASLPIFWAMLAKLFQVSGAFMCHSVVPMLFIPLGYIVYREIGLVLFKKDKRNVNIFLIIICITNMFIGKNYASSYEMLSTCIWQGGSFLYNIVLPGIFCFEFKYLRKNGKISDLVMVLAMILVGAMTVPITGGVLSVLLVLVLALSFAIDKVITKRKRMDAGIIN
ncbi:MAG: DUF6077 domain-containing protein [Lachnotalea sp.]